MAEHLPAPILSTMRLVTYSPGPQLSRFVEIIWIVNGVPGYNREMVLPNGAIEVIFNFGSYHKLVDKTNHERFQVFRDCWIAGLQEDSIVIEASRESNLLGIRFRPGGAYPFLHLPVFELTNRVIECEKLFGGWLSELRDHLFEAKSDDEKIRLIEAALLRRIDPRRIDPLIEYVLTELRSKNGQESIRQLSCSAGISNKHLITRMRKTVGTSPKLLARILRFQSVISLVKDCVEVNWTQVAHHCGYYDQAHMIREFHLFSNATPRDYLKHRDEDENHIIVD